MERLNTRLRVGGATPSPPPSVRRGGGLDHPPPNYFGGRVHAWPRPCVQPGDGVDGGGRLHGGPPLRRLSRGPRRARGPGPFLKAFPSSGQ